METKIILIRHGQSIGNLNKTFLGHTDLDLSELGYKQAECVCEFLSEEKIDAVYSSDLKRAAHTVEPIAKMRGLEVIKTEGMREIFAGDWEGKKFEELDVIYEKEYTVWKTDIGNAVCTNGENTAELQKRVLAEITKIAEENPGKTVCIGTHATPIRVLAAAWTGKTKDEIKDIPWAVNCSVTTAIYKNGTFELITYNENNFIGDLNTKFPANV